MDANDISAVDRDNTFAAPGMPTHPVEPEYRVISGFWRRLLAAVIDCSLLGLAGFVLGLFFFDSLARLGAWGRLLGFCVALFYFGVLNSKIGEGQTTGKRIMRIEVVDRTGRHISLRRSCLRYSVLGIPGFLNGVLLPPTATTWPFFHIANVIIFGFGGAAAYLYIFNWRTRQSLHDLAARTFVTRTSSSGDVAGAVRPLHLVIVSIWFAAVIVLTGAMAWLSQKGTLAELLDAQRAIQASGRFHMATAFVGKMRVRWRDGSYSETTDFTSTVVCKKRPADYQAVAHQVAAIVLDSYPPVMEKDLLIVNVNYGYDIGIARGWTAYSWRHPPETWKELLAEKAAD